MARLAMPLLAIVLATLSGCSSYRLEGVVVEGPESTITLVDMNDSRLALEGLDSVRVLVVIDPKGMDPKKLPPVTADPHGRFSIPINEMGAGWMEYEIMAVIRRNGYQSVVHNGPLPGGKQRLYVTLRAGRDNYRPEADIIEESIKAGKQWMDGSP